MVARTVPPPDHGLLPLRDLVVHARRNLTRGLLLSAFAHLAILTAFVSLRHREPALRTVAGTVDLVPNPAVCVPETPRIPYEGPRATDLTKGIVDPKPIPPEITTPLIPGLVDGRPFDGREVEAGPPTGTDGPAARVEPAADPPEGAFVYFDEPPLPLRRVQPDYPGWARENGIAGTVLLHVLVGQDGRVRRVSVIRGVTGLTEAAQEALHRWTFRPATAGGRAVAVWVEIPVEFRLGG